MPDLYFDRHVPHLPDRMFELVNELERYPRFLPNVSSMVVRPAGDAHPVARTIIAKAVDGPFAYLDSKWTFEPEGEGTRVRFDIDFHIANPLLAAVAEPAFAAKQQEIIDAFMDEADRRFG
jgi:coenzyme Q-binding protein COQ10